jgi:hypothetical protein
MHMWVDTVLQQVVQNVLRCTVVGVVANWFYTPDLQR